MNRLKSYVRKTILDSAREGAYPAVRRLAESTRIAFIDAMRGTDTGWWADLIYTSDMLVMAHKYRADIATALAEYREEVGESYVYRAQHETDVSAEAILASLIRRKPWPFSAYHERDEPGHALIGLRFAVEWYAGELARDYCPEL